MTLLRVERGIPGGMWDDGAVLAIIMVEEVYTQLNIKTNSNCMNWC